MSEQEELRKDIDDVARMLDPLGRGLATAHMRIAALAAVLVRKGVVSVDELKEAIQNVEADIGATIAVDDVLGDDRVRES